MINHLPELKEISEHLTEVTFKDKEHIENRLMSLAVYKARVNDITPEAQYLYNEKLSDVTGAVPSKFPKTAGNSSLIKSYIESEMRDYSRVLAYCDRINSTVNRQSENLRSVLSSMKEEMRQIH